MAPSNPRSRVRPSLGRHVGTTVPVPTKATLAERDASPSFELAVQGCGWAPSPLAGPLG